MINNIITDLIKGHLIRRFYTTLFIDIVVVKSNMTKNHCLRWNVGTCSVFVCRSLPPIFPAPPAPLSEIFESLLEIVKLVHFFLPDHSGPDGNPKWSGHLSRVGTLACLKVSDRSESDNNEMNLKGTIDMMIALPSKVYSVNISFHSLQPSISTSLCYISLFLGSWNIA